MNFVLHPNKLVKCFQRLYLLVANINILKSKLTRSNNKSNIESSIEYYINQLNIVTIRNTTETR